jgi:mannitol-1-phosphate/altronate dehydrogenase
MKVRIVHKPDGYWVVEKKFLFWWIEVEKFYQWVVEGNAAERSALKYAQLLINPTIIEVKK